MKNKYYYKNFIILMPILILLTISVLDMYGAAFISHLYEKALLKQVIWIIIGSSVMFIIYKLDMRFLLKYAKIFYIIGIIFLTLVLFIGKNVNGANSWFKIGPFSIQPSEIFKFFYLIYISKIVCMKNQNVLIMILKLIILTFIPCILIFLEPDTGVVLMYLLMLFGCILESNIPKKYIWSTIFISITLLNAFILLYLINSDLFIKLFGTSFFYRIDRILTFANSSSYQLNNALIGIGSSGFFGLGLQSEKIYIPEVTTDFVFSLSICNFGILMGLIIVCVYAFILYKIYKEIKIIENQFYKCVLSGIFYMMLYQIIEHIFMNLGLTPITGITLPFLSYGGSSILSYFMLFGIILKITTNNSSYS